MSDYDILTRAHTAHLSAVQAVLGPNMVLRQSAPRRIQGPRRRATEGDRKLKQMQRKLRYITAIAEMTGQPDLGELAEALLKDTEEKE